MRDPFEAFRHSEEGADPPSLTAIRSRARLITNRRWTALGAAASVVVAVAAVGLALQTSGEDPGHLAQEGVRQTFGDAPQADRATPETLAEMDADEEAVAPGTTTRIIVEGDRAAVSQATSADGSGLVARLEINEAEGGADFVFNVCNESGSPVSRDFGTSQRYDMEVLRDGAVVWRWSDDMAFLQVLGTETWGPGECSTYEEHWDGTGRTGRMPPGSYEGAASLTSMPPLETRPVGFCLTPC
jgi:hypothetical protein